MRVQYDEGSLGAVEVESADVKPCKDFEWCSHIDLEDLSAGQEVEAR